ncbi:MAG: hypothetical protein ACJ72G_00315, partial [Friedmanniella sp.]
GLPALVLTFYGTTSLLPLDLGRRGLAFLPVALSLVIALAMVWSPPLKKALGGIRTPLGGVALVFLVLLWAGLYPPGL